MIIKKDTHTHTRLTALCPGLPGWAGTRKVKPIWILLKQETVSGSGISWAICKSAPCSRQITTRAPHHSVFLQAGCPSCRPTNSVKALKAAKKTVTVIHNLYNLAHKPHAITAVPRSYKKNIWIMLKAHFIAKYRKSSWTEYAAYQWFAITVRSKTFRWRECSSMM